MIDPALFVHAKNQARKQLKEEEAQHSFGYYIHQADHDKLDLDMTFRWLEIHHADPMIENLKNEQLLPLSNTDKEFIKRMSDILSNISSLIMTNRSLDFDGSVHETLFDIKMITRHVSPPYKVLDIGAGAGRHSIAWHLTNPDGVYVSMDSMMIQYFLQNLIMSYLGTLNGKIRVFEFMNRAFQTSPFPDLSDVPSGSMYHLPFWETDRLPDQYFDVIMCCCMIDELGPDDFKRVVDVIKTKLAPEGIFYCRGSQNRAHMEGHHGIDITTALNDAGLSTVYCDLKPQITRVMAKNNSRRIKSSPPLYSTFYDQINDQKLCDRLSYNTVFINRIIEMEPESKKAVVWAEPKVFEKVIHPVAHLISIVAIVNENDCYNALQQFGYLLCSPEELSEIEFDLLIVSPRSSKTIQMGPHRVLLNNDNIQILNVFDLHPFAYTINHPSFFSRQKHLLSKSKRIGIFGASGGGDILLDKLSFLGYRIVCFFDNDTEKQGRGKKGLDVRSPDELAYMFPRDVDFILISSYAFNEIACQLITMGLIKGNDFGNASEFSLIG